MDEHIPHAYEHNPASDTPRTGAVARAGAWCFALAAFLLLALSAVVTWRWLDYNVLHWGVEDGKAVAVNDAELLERVRAFELATIKHTYSGRARLDALQMLAAGPLRYTFPGWAAGQRLDVSGEVRVAAGVDLSGVGRGDMDVTREGNATRVVVRLPAPQILSAELMPDTLHTSTRSGLITRLGVGDPDLRDRAADEVTRAARTAAVEQGILDDATRETQRRLEAFLQSLPQSGGRIAYTVEVREPAIH
jgi:uncharacterized protein DUF4230